MAVCAVSIPVGCSTAPLQEIVPQWGPYITNTDDNSALICWKTPDAGSALVRFATDEYFQKSGTYNQFVADSNRIIHQVKINGLDKATHYHYRIWFAGAENLSFSSDKAADIESFCSSHGATADHTFQTLGADTFTFIVYGDTRSQPPLYTEMDRHKLVADRIAQEKDVSFVLHTGDIVFDAGNNTYWDDFFNAAREMLPNTTFYPIQGNHDEANIYFDVFGVNAFYSFSSGDTRVVALDSSESADYDAEAVFAANELSGNETWKFVFLHYPIFTSEATHWGGWTDLQQMWHPIFVKSGVAAVFNAHVHVYERDLEGGINYMTLATGGAPSYQLAEKKIPGYQSSLENVLGYEKVSVTPEEVDMSFIMVAKILPDGKTIEMYPPGTVSDSIRIIRSGGNTITLVTAGEAGK